MAKAGDLETQKDKIRDMIETQLLTQKRVAEILEVNRTSVERACKRWGLKTQRTGPRALEGHPKWKGGRYQLGRYWYVRADHHPNRTKAGYVAEHRLVMEQKLGRFLARTEVVHHIDGDPENNHPDNLMVFQSNPDHLRHELAGRIPQWTEEGRARTLAGVRRGNATRHHKGRDDNPPPRPTVRQPSLGDSSDEAPICGTAPMPKREPG